MNTKNKIIKKTTLLTITDCQNIIKKLDPDTAITNYHIRNLAEQGLMNRVPIMVLTTGKKKIIRVFDLLNYAGFSIPENGEIIIQDGEIRIQDGSEPKQDIKENEPNPVATREIPQQPNYFINEKNLYI